MKKAAFAVLLGSLLVLAGLAVGCSQGAEEPEPQADAEPPPPRKMPGDFVTIPAGEFTMGSDERPEKQKDTPQFYEPAHTVELPEYEIAVFEVTNAEYIKFELDSDYTAEGPWRRYYAIGKEDFPVADVTWNDAKAYCEWAGGRLPTEAEWEKAARGPENYSYPWGNDWRDGMSNCNELGLATVVEVGEMTEDVSGYGVRDMLGNVAEWTADTFKPYPKSPKRRDPNFGKGFKTVRGASYAIKGRSFHLYSRSAYLPKAAYGFGFRCVKDVATEGEEQ